MNVLIIGGGGFLGSYLARNMVDRGNNVSILGRNLYPNVNSKINSIKADIRDRASIIKALKSKKAIEHLLIFNDF